MILPLNITSLLFLLSRQLFQIDCIWVTMACNESLLFQINHRVESFQFGILFNSCITPELHCLLARVLNLSHLLHCKLLSPLERGRLAVAESGRDTSFVCFCMAVQEGGHSGMDGEAKEVEHLLSVFHWVHAEVLISEGHVSLRELALQHLERMIIIDKIPAKQFWIFAIRISRTPSPVFSTLYCSSWVSDKQQHSHIEALVLDKLACEIKSQSYSLY